MSDLYFNNFFIYSLINDYFMSTKLQQFILSLFWNLNDYRAISNLCHWIFLLILRHVCLSIQNHNLIEDNHFHLVSRLSHHCSLLWLLKQCAIQERNKNGAVSSMSIQILFNLIFNAYRLQNKMNSNSLCKDTPRETN